MRPRYLIAVAESRALLRDVKAKLRAAYEGSEGGQTVLERGRLLVFVIGDAVCKLGRDGALIGTIFKFGTPAADTLDETDQQAAIDSRGAYLIDRCWGGYVAVLCDTEASRSEILRAPFGDLTCYWTRVEDMILFASDVRMMRAAGMPAPSIAAAALARHLAAEDIRRPETCLEHVRELSGGQRVTIESNGPKEESLWLPWRFARSDRQVSGIDESARLIRDAALQSVSSRAASHSHVLLKLSGGLDSSIVCACLHHARMSFAAITLATDDPSGDERAHARIVARSLGVRLVERYRDPLRVRLEHSSAERLPRPTARSFTQESARIAEEVAVETGSDAIFDGGGGDNVFCSLQSARPAADCLLSGWGPRLFWQTIEAIAQISQTSVWEVARRAWMIRRRRSPAYRWPLDTRFLSAPARCELKSALDHPWLDTPMDILPGKSAHIALITAAQSVAEGFDVESKLPTYSPLISQPLVEACLQIPSWLWFSDGRNRVIARQAFAGRLPDATLRRRSKGAPDSFIAKVFELNRQKIRTLLLGGVLNDLGILDAEAVAKELDGEAPVRGHDFLRIMQLVDAEAWSRRWS